MKTIYILMLATLSPFLSFNLANAQAKRADIKNLIGTWEFVKPQNAINPTGQFFTTLRTFDTAGNYEEVFVTTGGTYIQSKAKFELVDSVETKGFLNHSVKEVINYSINDSRLGKTFNFRCGIVSDDGNLFLLTEGGKKNVDGVEVIEWREMWRKVQEPKKSLSTSPAKL